MTNKLTRRKLVTTGIASAATMSGIGAAIHLGGRYDLIPPMRGSLLDFSETLTYATQRLLTAGQPLAREFERSAISEIHPVNGPAPMDETYRVMAANGFQDWRLVVEGSVARPRSFSLGELKAMPAATHINLHACEEGWSYIAQWTGVRLSTVLEAAEIRPEAKYVNFVPFANPNSSGRIRVSGGGSIGMADALHPQTLLAYAMNGENLPLDHGAPVRLRLSRLLGYKNTKFLLRIVVTDNSDFYHAGGNTWYGGI